MYALHSAPAASVRTTTKASPFLARLTRAIHAANGHDRLPPAMSGPLSVRLV